MSPHLPIIKSALVITALLAVAIFSSGQNGGNPAGKKPYIRTGYEDTLSGTITLAGKRPKPLIIDMSADPRCNDGNADPTTDWVMGHEGKLANVFVYIKSEALDGYSFEQPTSPAMLEHKGCRYVPHLLGIRVGQPLMILNSDPTIHNTYPTTRDNKEWNQSQPVASSAIRAVFDLPETFIPFKDNLHPWEKAYVGVFAHPFFTISDDFGNYRIEGLPPGHYTVVAWHERFGEKTVEVTLVPGEARDISFNFEAKK